MSSTSPFRSLAWAAAFAGAAACVAAEGPPAQDETALDTARVVAGLQDWLDGTRDLQGSFEQALVSGALGAGLEERGRLYVKRPGRMRWDYRDPDNKVAIVDGNRTWLYLEEESQLLLGRLEDRNRLLSTLVSAEQPIGDLFEAELVAGPKTGGSGSYLLELKPKPAAEAFEKVVVTLSAPGFAIDAAEVLDSAGNRMLYRFTRLRRNRGLPDGLFEFDPPQGTTVMGSH